MGQAFQIAQGTYDTLLAEISSEQSEVFQRSLAANVAKCGEAGVREDEGMDRGLRVSVFVCVKERDSGL